MITNIVNSGDPSRPIFAHAGQSPQEFQEFLDKDAIAPCPSCGSTRFNVVKMPDHCHFAAIRCGRCDTFLRWQAKPKNFEVQQRQQTTISLLLKSPHLSEWERTFLQGLKGKKLSPRQQAVLAEIETKVGQD